MNGARMCLYFSFAISMLILHARAEDKVTFVPENTESPVTLVGEILDYNGAILRLKTLSGEPQTVPSPSITSIETRYSPEYLQGIEEYRRGETSAAIKTLTKAKLQEPRKWVDREILAWLVRCYDRQYDLPNALITFQQLTQEDPNTRHWNVAPLVWAPTTTSDTLRAQARQWLIGSNRVNQLCGASLLLLEPTYGDAAERTLQQLTRDPNLNISSMAKCQLWRRKLSDRTVDDFTMKRWSQQVERLPEQLQNGPMFLLGSGYAVLQQYRKSAAAYLWIPLVYAEQESLSARAMYEAAEALKRAGLETEATRLYQEIPVAYHWSTEAKLVRNDER